jgi:hypothetical protein
VPHRVKLNWKANLLGIFLAVPYGILADTYGRIVVCGAGIIGVTAGYCWLFAVLYFYETLPFNLIYAYPLFFCIGGGGPVVAALILAIITDVTPKEIRLVLPCDLDISDHLQNNGVLLYPYRCHRHHADRASPWSGHYGNILSASVVSRNYSSPSVVDGIAFHDPRNQHQKSGRQHWSSAGWRPETFADDYPREDQEPLPTYCPRHLPHHQPITHPPWVRFIYCEFLGGSSYRSRYTIHVFQVSLETKPGMIYGLIRAGC